MLPFSSSKHGAKEGLVSTEVGLRPPGLEWRLSLGGGPSSPL